MWTNLHSADSERLEEQGEGRLASSKTTIEKADTRNDEPNDGRTEEQVRVMELKSSVLSIHILVQGVAAIGLVRIVLGLQELVSDLDA